MATAVRREPDPNDGAMQVRAHHAVTKKWHAIWNWSKTEVVDAIAKTRLKLAGE